MDGGAGAQPIRQHNWVTYLLVRLYCRRPEQEISLDLYRYFRRLDDRVDDPALSAREKTALVAAERRRIEALYHAADPADPLDRVVRYDRAGRLRGWIRRMLDVFEFDARRTGQVVDRSQIMAYSRNLSEAYTRFLVEFLEPRYAYEPEDARLAHACHLLHMLRDHDIDQDLGYDNIGQDEAEHYGFQPGDCEGSGFRRWLQERLDLIEGLFASGRRSIRSRPYLRIKLIVHLYCFRYETVLRRIQRHGLHLPAAGRPGLLDLLGCGAGCMILLLDHAWQRLRPW